MPYRSNVFQEGSYYHVYNRGANRDLVFFCPENYDYCLRLFARYRQKHAVSLVAYCLMPNHYHLLLRQEADKPLSNCINSVFGAYVQAVNRQQGRTGTLFEGRFRHIWVEEETHLISLCRYLHLNPVRARLCSRAEDWPYSDCLEWLGLQHQEVTGSSLTRHYFPTARSYALFLHDSEKELSARNQIMRYTTFPRG